VFTGSWCVGIGLAGWLVVIALWAAFLALVVWALAALFPIRRKGPGPASRAPATSGDADAEPGSAEPR
jgi:hypothetical protein